MKEQSAVDFLHSKILFNIGLDDNDIFKLRELAKIAKKLEEKQHGKTWDAGLSKYEVRAGNYMRAYEDFDDWYTETYGSKGSDETNGINVEKVPNVISSQTEINGSKGSDETNGNNVEEMPNVSILKGHLKNKSKRWFVAYNIDAFEGEFPIHPKYEKYYFLDEEDEGKEVEFEIIKYDGTTEVSEGWGGYAKLTSKIIQNHIVDTNEMISSQTEISDEEIEKEAIQIYSALEEEEFVAWKNGAKWYREQIKKKQ